MLEVARHQKKLTAAQTHLATLTAAETARAAAKTAAIASETAAAAAKKDREGGAGRGEERHQDGAGSQGQGEEAALSPGGRAVGNPFSMDRHTPHPPRAHFTVIALIHPRGSRAGHLP